MNPSLILLAGALARPRGRRPTCTGSRLALAAGCVHPDHTACCPTCGGDVATVPALRRAVRLATHPERGGFQ